MKSFIFLIVVLLGGALLFGQKFEVGVNGGKVYNWAQSPWNGQYHLTKLSALGASVTYGNKKFSAGLSVEWRHHAYTDSNYANQMALYPPGPRGYCGLGPDLNYTKVSINVVPVKFCLDKKFVFGRFETYAGFISGISFGQSKADYVYFEWDAENNHKTTDSERDYFVGVQTGCTWMVNERLGINAEVAGEKYIYFHNGERSPYDSYYVPVTLGLRYKL